jgi:hypothetical protein
LALTVRSNQINNSATKNGNSSNIVNNIFAILIPLALSAINVVTPMFLKTITNFEKWDSSQLELTFLLFRTYLSNTLNTMILAISYLLLADPFLLAQYPSLRVQVESQVSGFFFFFFLI